MAARGKTPNPRGKKTQRAKPTRSSRDGDTKQDPDDLRIHKYEFEKTWDAKTKPDWHPIRKMRYIFWRMMSGSTVTDAIREILWHENEFWNLIDLKRHGPFREEFKRAKTLQARAFADSVVIIAEGRDRVSRRERRIIRKIIEKATKKIGNQKSSLAAKAIFAAMMADLREHDKIVMSRNKLQIEAAKWIAKTANPAEFGEKSTVALGTPDGEGSAIARPIMIQFVGPDGKVVGL